MSKSSHAIICRNITLGSHQAQQVHKRVFEEVSRSFYLLSIVLRIITNDENAREVESIVDKDIQDTTERLSNEIARLEKLCEDNGLEGEMHFSRPQEELVEISTPRAARFVGMLSQLDTLIGLLSALWLAGVCSDTQYSAETYQWQRNLISMAGRIRGIAARAMAAARRDNSQALEEAGIFDEDMPEEGESDDEPVDKKQESGKSTARAEKTPAKPAARRKNHLVQESFTETEAKSNTESNSAQESKDAA